MLVNDEETRSAIPVVADDPTFTVDAGTRNTETSEEEGTDASIAAATSTTVSITNDNTTETYTFMKDIFHSLPAMEHDELEKIVQQTSQLWTNDNDDDASRWNTHVIAPFWMENQTRKCRNATVESASSSKQQQRNMYSEHITQLQKQIQDYQTSQYSEKSNVMASFQVTTVNTITTEPSDIIVRTYVEYIDTANCSTATWEVTWTIQIVDDLTATLSGTIRIHTHYYENNTNSQMQCQEEVVKNHTLSLQEEKVNSLVAKFEKNTLSYAEKLVTKIVQYIIRTEEEFYTTIVDHFSNDSHHVDDNDQLIMIHDQLRSLRRILPITKHKFQWNQKQSSQHKNMMVQQQMMLMRQHHQQPHRRNNDPK